MEDIWLPSPNYLTKFKRQTPIPPHLLPLRPQNQAMSLQCGIVGLPNVGKSTLFNALTSAKALAANYPFATKDPNLGVITVPDERLDKLSELVNPQKVQPTTVDILDIAGLIKGASKGEGLGNQFLGNIREVDAIVHVVRCFEDDNVVHVDGSVDPVRDKGIIDTELILKDIETVEKKIDKLRRLAKSGEKDAKRTVELGDQLLEHLGDDKPARTFKPDDDEVRVFLRRHRPGAPTPPPNRSSTSAT